MKVRWREHEMIVVTFLFVWQIVMSFVSLSNIPAAEVESVFAAPFRENGLTFRYLGNLILPQISSTVLMFGIYLLINLFVLPSIRKISGDDIESLFSRRMLTAVISIVIVSFILANGVNIISFYARPYLFSYRDYQFLALMGYNDRPLENLFFGFGRALAAVSLFTLIGGARELLIWLIERPVGRREYRILVANNTIPFVALYFLVLVLINPTHDDFLRYLVFVTPTLGLYVYLTFGLFPYKGEKRFPDKGVALRLFIATFICSVPSLILFFGHRNPFIPFFYWILLLSAVTPLFWLIYQQRKDKILQLKNMETALARSDANLQYLKSQINPHFLFNALNTLYGTALKGEVDKTAEGIQRLGDMMRFMLHENSLDRIPMDKELEYLKNFIALQKLRIASSPDILIEDEIDESQTKAQIAPMLLIPFVENAFKHGISLNEKSWIKIGLRCVDNVVNFEVKNSLHRNEKNMESGKSGIGLMNVKGRLELQYAGRHILDINETENEFTVKLILKC